MKENGMSRPTRETVEDTKSGQMGLFMKATGRMIKPTAGVD